MTPNWPAGCWLKPRVADHLVRCPKDLRVVGSGLSVRDARRAPSLLPLLHSLVPLPPPAARWLRLVVFLFACRYTGAHHLQCISSFLGISPGVPFRARLPFEGLGSNTRALLSIGANPLLRAAPEVQVFGLVRLYLITAQITGFIRQGIPETYQKREAVLRRGQGQRAHHPQRL